MGVISTLVQAVTGNNEEIKTHPCTIQTLPSGTGHPYHLALSGGGLRGFAHIGVYRALVEAGYEIASVSGTSMGALVGVFIAAQYLPQEIEAVFTRDSIYDLLKVTWSTDGMFSVEKIKKILEYELQINNLEDLSLPFTVCVTDFIQGKPVYYSSGLLKKIVIASCAIPGVFEPVSYEDTLLVDGGVFDNMPIETQTELPVIASHVNPRIFDPDDPTNNIAIRAIEMMIGRDMDRKKTQCELFIEPPELANL